MTDNQHIGVGCLSCRPDILSTRTAMLDAGQAGHIQLLIIPGHPESTDQSLEICESYTGMIRIHAPHHLHQVNPCAPDLFPGKKPDSIAHYIEDAMALTCEAADRTASPVIVIHAGQYLPGTKNEAIFRFHEFLDTYQDPRFILESLPALVPGLPFLGTTPEELEQLGKHQIAGYCLDFPHLWCTAESTGSPIANLMEQMENLPICFSHLSGSPGADSEHQHLLFDDPENRYDLTIAHSFLSHHQNLEVSLEFATNDPDVIRDQIRILTHL
ncbi:MAG TPA: xylose isomerase [Methanospirillum sp.]|nr:xylose isomerase [Methanospirillum sp.]